MKKNNSYKNIKELNNCVFKDDKHRAFYFQVEDDLLSIQLLSDRCMGEGYANSTKIALIQLDYDYEKDERYETNRRD